jgi:flavin reductase (DIM6/NTAB) family NADH-FMN oxidoreductase RutF
MPLYDQNALEGLEQRFRANLINSLPGAKALALVGTRSREGQENLAVFNSVFHVGANPAMIGLVFRPDSVDRHTLSNIRETGFYTLNQVHAGMVAAAHQTSARYAAEVSEFEATGLNPLYNPGFEAPAVKESTVRIGLELAEEIPVRSNGTILIIGKVLWLELPDAAIGADGFVDPMETGVVSVCGLDAYYGLQPLARYAYAKPDLPPRKV